MIQEFTAYVANNTSFTLGTDLFAEFKPILEPEPLYYVIMQNTGSGSVNFHAPQLSESNVEVMSFSKKDYSESARKALEIYELVKQLNQLTLPIVAAPVGTGEQLKLEISHAKSKPTYKGQTEKSYHVSSFMVMCKIRNL